MNGAGSRKVGRAPIATAAGRIGAAARRMRRTMGVLRALGIGAAALAAGCGSSRLVLPAGAGAPYPEFERVFGAAVAECRGIRSAEMMIALGGRGGGARLRGRVRAGLAAPGSMRLEGLAPFGAPVFYLVASPADATLWLTREARAVAGVPAADLFASLTGIRFGPDDLRAVLTGCLVPDPRPTAGRRHGDWVAVELAGGAVAWLRPAGGGHRLVAGTRDGLTIEYGEFGSRSPRLVRVVSDAAAGGEPLTDLTARLSQVSLNVELVPEAFSLAVPADVLPATLEDLRGAGPLEAPVDPT